MAYKSPLAGYYDNDGAGDEGEYKSPLSGYYPTKSKQDIEDEERRKKLQAFKDAEKNQAPVKTAGDHLKDAGKFLGDVGKGIFDSTIGAAGNTLGNLYSLGDTASKQRAAEKANKEYQTNSKTLDQLVADGKMSEQDALKKRNEAFKKVNETSSKASQATRSSNQIDKTKAAGDAAETALNVGTLGVGGIVKSVVGATAKTTAKTVGEEVVKTGFKEGAKKLAGNMGKDAVLGMGYGAADTAARQGDEATAEDYRNNVLGGGVLGAAAPVAGKVIGGVVKSVKGSGKAAKLADLEAKQAAEDEAARQMTISRLSKEAKNSLENDATGTKKGGIERAAGEIDNGSAKPVRYRITPEGEVVIEDGRHRIEAARAAGIEDFPMEDVTDLYTPTTTPSGKVISDVPMPKTVEARKNQGFMEGDILADGTSTNRVGKAVEDVVTDPIPETGTQQSRYVSKTLKESEFIGGETKKKLGAEYETTNNAIRGDNSLRQLDAEGVDNFSTKVYDRLDEKHVTDQTVFDAQAAAQALEARGGKADLQRAADIYNKLSTHLSKAGQTVQAAAIMARQTPQGLSYYAQKQFKNAGVDFTPQLQKELKAHIDAVKNAEKGSDEMAIARDNVQYFIAQNIPSSKADQIINFWRAGLLTAPTTTGGALVGNAAQALNRKLLENPVGIMADMVQSMFTGKRALTAAKAGELGKGAKTGAENAVNGQYWKTGYDPMTLADQQGKYDQPNRMINYGTTPLGKATGHYVNGVYKLMGASDQPFRYGAQREALSSLANAEVKNQGLKGDEAKAFYDDFMANPPKDALNTATKDAKYQTFQNDTALGKIVAGAKNSLRAQGHNKTAAMLDFFVPFNNVPSAVASRLVTNTPIGTASTLIENIIKVRKGEKWDQRAVSQAVGRGMSGLPILAAGYALAQGGNVTGGYPATKAERDQWEAEGKQPNSIKVNGRWYSLNYIQPFATLLATGAKFAEAKQAGLNVEEQLTQSLNSAGNSLMSQSFLQGISGAMDAVKNPTEFGGRYIANTAAGIIPNVIRSAARAGDPLLRESEGVVDGIKGGIPGLRGELPVKTNDMGEALTAKDTFANQYLNPLKPSREKFDENTKINNEAILPASRLKSVRQKEITQLLDKGSVEKAQRKIDEYNKEVTKVLAPYVNNNPISPEQLDRIDNLYLGEVWINEKGRPTISKRSDLPN
jgi:hypothetical protein